MRERGSIQNPLDNPFYAEQQIQAGIKKVLGNNVRFHHAIILTRYAIDGGIPGWIFGELYSSNEEATQAREELIQGAKTLPGRSPHMCPQTAEEWQKESEVVPINEGDTYVPYHFTYGDSRKHHSYQHGVDDGTHGSENKG